MKLNDYMPDDSFGDDPQGLLYSESERGQLEKKRRRQEEQRLQQQEAQNQALQSELLASKDGPPRAEERPPRPEMSPGMAMLMDQAPQMPPPQQEQAGPPVPTREELLAERADRQAAPQQRAPSRYSQIQLDAMEKAAKLSDPDSQPFWPMQRAARQRTVQQLLSVAGSAEGASQHEVEQQRWDEARARQMKKQPVGTPHPVLRPDGRQWLTQQVYNPSTEGFETVDLGEVPPPPRKGRKYDTSAAKPVYDPQTKKTRMAIPVIDEDTGTINWDFGPEVPPEKPPQPESPPAGGGYWTNPKTGKVEVLPPIERSPTQAPEYHDVQALIALSRRFEEQAQNETDPYMKDALVRQSRELTRQANAIAQKKGVAAGKGPAPVSGGQAQPAPQQGGGPRPGQTATNPKTGQKIQWNGQTWVPAG